MDLDISQRLDQGTPHRSQSHTNGAESPKELTSRLRILELFTLHVLPRNEEWEYARSFISMSDVLDDERREAFLQSLQELQNVKEHEMVDEAATRQQEEDAKLQEELGERNRAEAENAASRPRASGQNGSIHRRTSSEVDYGIEKKQPKGSAVPTAPKTKESATPSNSASGAATGASRFPAAAEASRNRNVRKSSQKGPPVYLQHVRNLFRVMQSLVRNMATAIEANPTVLLKMLLSVLAIIMALSRRDIRGRARRILGKGWDKVMNTVGMGVKVSYI